MPRQKHVLIVDDSSDDRELFEYYLAQQGYLVSVAENGKEGIEKALEIQPDLILMDLWLPSVSGWEATMFLRSDERTKNCPIIIITAHEVYQPSTLACDSWLTKPCPFDRLDAEIERVLESRA